MLSWELITFWVLPKTRLGNDLDEENLKKFFRIIAEGSVPK